MGVYNGTVVGSPTFPAGKFGNCLTGTSDSNYISLPTATNPFSFGQTATWTVEAWVKTSSSSGVQVFATNGAAASSGNWWFGISSGKLSATIEGTGGFLGTFGTGTISDNVWHHAALVVTAGTSATIYLDGVAAGTNTGARLSPTNNNGFIGRFNITSFSWGGSVDEVAVWNTAKYTSTFTPPTSAYAGNESGLVALYHLNSDGTDSGPTLTVYNPIVGEYGGTTVALSWAAATNGVAPISYQVQRAPDSSGSPGTFANDGSSVTALTYTSTGLTASTKYWFRVAVTDSASSTATTLNVSQTTLTSGLKYNRLDATDPVYGQAIMLLVPNAASSNPYNSSNPTKLILYFHGAGEDQTALISDSLKTTCVAALSDAGYIQAGSAAHGTNNWGNQASVDDYAGLWQYCNTNYNISKTGFWGQSMGGLDSLLALSEHKIPNVVGWLGTYPVCNLANLYSLGTYTSAINTAYGITGTGNATYTNLTIGHDPVLKWGWAFRRVPMRIYSSSGDTVVPKSNNADALNTLLSSSETVTVIATSGNHGDASNFVPSEYVAFFNSSFASPTATSGGSGVMLANDFSGGYTG